MAVSEATLMPRSQSTAGNTCGNVKRAAARGTGRRGGGEQSAEHALGTAASRSRGARRRGALRRASGDKGAASAADAANAFTKDGFESVATIRTADVAFRDECSPSNQTSRKSFVSRSVTLDGETSLSGACAALRAALEECTSDAAGDSPSDVCAAVRGINRRIESQMTAPSGTFPSTGVGVLRIEVPITLPRHAMRMKPMAFLQLVREYEQCTMRNGGDENTTEFPPGSPRGEYGFYFSSRVHSGADTDEDCTSGAEALGVRAEQIVAACHGAALLWTSYEDKGDAEGIGSWTAAGREGSAYAADLAEIEELTLGGNRGRGDSARCSRVRVFGGMRFDASESSDTSTSGSAGSSRAPISEEWRRFGSHVFMLPRVELLEDDGTGIYLAVNVAWGVEKNACTMSRSSFVQDAAVALRFVGSVQGAIDDPASTREVESAQCRSADADFDAWLRDGGEDKQEMAEPEYDEWDSIVGSALHEIERSRSGREAGPLSGPGVDDLEKVVLARRMVWRCRNVRPLRVLRLLQQRNDSSFHVALLVPGGDAFICCTPERLFARRMGRICSEAVAGTRQRGARTEDDAALAFDLMMNGKDGAEFAVVREQVEEALRSLCGEEVTVLSKKEVMRQAQIQHLYSRIDGRLSEGIRNFDVLQTLHPTPAICGHPRASARAAINALEPFDRGFYAGPIGWMSSSGADFAVAIRSALVHSAPDDGSGALPVLPSSTGDLDRVIVYSGVGIVHGSDPTSEWNELNLKARQFSVVLRQPPIMRPTDNMNLAHARAMVEELIRLGLSYYVISPGSRSSPLALAVGENHHVTFVSCIDERSAGFHALGYGIATNRPAVVVTSSGTATANLFPAVMEANEAGVPLLLLTADRPFELHGIGANQSVDQTNLYGAHVRATYQLPPPAASEEAFRNTLTLVGEAAIRAMTQPQGPVHINCMFRDPLAPTQASIESRTDVRSLLEASREWIEDSAPYVRHVVFGTASPFATALPERVRALISSACCGMIIAGNIRPEEIGATISVASTLGWPIIADVTSGLRLRSAGCSEATIVHQMDLMLSSAALRSHMSPDCIIQFGSRIVSKRLLSFIGATAAARLESHGDVAVQTCPLILIGEPTARNDPTNSRSVRVHVGAEDFARGMRESFGRTAVKQSQRQYTASVSFLSSVATRKVAMLCVEQERQQGQLSEPAVASIVSSMVPRDHALFLGNSMPIRDVDMFGCATTPSADGSQAQTVTSALWQLPRVVANRGASGIDGLLSTAIGYASGSNTPTTLLVGDVSFVHDTNGLLMLRDTHSSLGTTNHAHVPPMTIVVVNNAGGGIFSFLPISETYSTEELQTIWETPPDVNIQSLAQAHKLNYRLCVSAAEVRESLTSSWRGESKTSAHTIIEVLVMTDKQENVNLHDAMMREVRAAIEHAHDLTLSPEQSGDDRRIAEAVPPETEGRNPRVSSMRYRRHELQYAHEVVSGRDRIGTRRGLTLEVRLCSGAVGRGDVSPLPGFHRETLREAEAQLSMACDLIAGKSLPLGVALLDGRLDEWLLLTLGSNLTRKMYPSVRCGIEVAVLNAVAAHRGSSSIAAFVSRGDASEGVPHTISNNGVVIGAKDGAEAVDEVLADVKDHIFRGGFRTLKLKVGRSDDPVKEAQIVNSVFRVVLSSSSSLNAVDGAPAVRIRLDANRLWSYQRALAFVRALDPCHETLIEYIEEPVDDPNLLSKFHAETLMPIALDETVDELASAASAEGTRAGLEGMSGILPYLQDPAIVAIIMKPNILGSIELVASLARCCRAFSVMPILSNTFESSLMLRFYYQLALGVDNLLTQSAARVGNQHPAHGLGTLDMLATDVLRECPEGEGTRGAPSLSSVSNDSISTLDILASNAILRRSILNEEVFTTAWMPAPTLTQTVVTDAFAFNVVESRLPPPAASRAGTSAAHAKDVLVFLHGFLGDATDWLPIMNSLADEDCRCLAIDLPEHGRTLRRRGSDGSRTKVTGGTPVEDPDISLDSIVKSVVQCIETVVGGEQAPPSRVTLVGYSMGGRIAYAVASMMAQLAGRTEGACTSPTVIALSASPGIEDAALRAQRLRLDNYQAQQLLEEGPARFVRDWYEGDLWDSLRRHPHFREMRDKRIGTLNSRGNALDGFANLLLAMSPGAVAPAFDSLFQFNSSGGVGGSSNRVFAIVGEYDKKYLAISDEMIARAIITEKARLVIDGCGHALHIESPNEVAAAIRRILPRSRAC